MIAFIMAMILAASAQARGARETVGSSSSVRESTEASPQGDPYKLYWELQCVANAIGGTDSSKIRCLGEGYQKAWMRLQEKGLRVPGKVEREHFWAQIFHESGRLRNMTQDGASKHYKGRGPIQLTHCYNYASFARFVRTYRNDGSALAMNTRSSCRGNTPPADLKNDPIMVDPESALGESASSCELQALSSIWFVENKKVADELRNKRSRKGQPTFRQALNSRNVTAVTKKINGGTIGLSERQNFYSKIQNSGCVR